MVFGVFLVVYNVVLVKKYMGIFLEPRESALGWVGWIPFAVNELEAVAKEKGIVVYVDIDVPGKMKFNDEDMSILLGNAIDNAVEALERAEGGNKRIWVSVRYCKGMLQIRFKNDCADSGEGRKRISSKPGKYHGIGLLSISRIVRKYKGSMKAGVKDGLFCLEITLYEDLT